MLKNFVFISYKHRIKMHIFKYDSERQSKNIHYDKFISFCLWKFNLFVFHWLSKWFLDRISTSSHYIVHKNKKKKTIFYKTMWTSSKCLLFSVIYSEKKKKWKAKKNLNFHIHLRIYSIFNNIDIVLVHNWEYFWFE